MPIEDVQYLLRNSVQDSTLLFIDSAKRDYVHYPTPAEFVVDLQEPIRNVFGFEVLDAAIANTMYNVDVNNCHLRFMLVDQKDSTVLPGGRVGDSLPPSDGIDQGDLAALNSAMFSLGFASPLREWLGDKFRSTFAVAVVDGDDARIAADPPPTPSYDAPAYPPADPDGVAAFNYVLVRRIHASVPMRFVTSSKVPLTSQGRRSSSSWVPFNGSYYSTVDEGNEEVDAILGRLPPRFSIAASPRGGGGGGSTALFDITTYEPVALAQAQFEAYTGIGVSGVTLTPPADALSGQAGPTRVPVLLAFGIGSAVLELGNYAGNTQLQTSLAAAFSDAGAGVAIVPTTSAGLDKQARLRLVTETALYRLLLVPEVSSLDQVIGVDQHPSLQINARTRAGRSHGAVALGGSVHPMYASVQRDGEGGQQLDAPGIINLTGTRYVTLRCPEIEEHVGSQGKYGPFSTGIGVFKLQSTNEVVQVRSDYVNLVRKPFHPIGRLLRITFRFELLDGTLFDFKGVNNQMLVAVKYYAPTPNGGRGVGESSAGGTHVVSVLNPDYDPDFHRYQARQSVFATRLDDQGFDPYDEDDEDNDFFQDDDDDDDDENQEAAMRRFDVVTQKRILDIERSARSRDM